MKVEVRYLKDSKRKNRVIKKGEIIITDKEWAEHLIETGYAELVKSHDKDNRFKKLNFLSRLNFSFEFNDNSIRIKHTKKDAIEILESRLIEKGIDFKKYDKEININKEFFDDLEKNLDEIISYFDKFEPTKEQIKSSQKTELKNQILQLIAVKRIDEATEMIVKLIKNNNHIYSIMQDDKREVWFYEDGVYKPNGISKIKTVCRNILGQAYTSQRANKVIDKIEADTFIDAGVFFKKESENECEIAVQNGILNVITKELMPFNHKKVFFNKINAKYDPEADCPITKEFFKNTLECEEDSKVAFELSGNCLYKKYYLQKAFMFVGSGENGKGVFIEHLQQFLGKENCSALPLSQLTNSGFMVCDLFGKLANIAGDLSNTDLKDTGMLKSLTSGTDLITVDRKFKTALSFINYAKMIFCCNELPRVYDTSHGFWRRWEILKFPHTFLKEKEYNLRKKEPNIKKADEGLLDKLLTPEELSGFLNECLEGLQRLLKNKQYSITKSTEETKELWIRNSDSFQAFCLDSLEDDFDSYISKKILRKRFNEYCKKHKIKGTSDKNIKAVLENLYGVTESRKMIGTDNERVWEGVNFKKEQKNIQGIQDIHGISPHSDFKNPYATSETMDKVDTMDISHLKPMFSLGFPIPMSKFTQYSNKEEIFLWISDNLKSGLLFEPKPGHFQKVN